MQLNNSALQANRNRVGPIVSAELGEYVCDVALNGRVGDREPIGDLLVGVPGGNQTQYIDFALGQLIIRNVVSQVCRNLGGYSLLPGMDSTDRLQELSVHVSLQYVTPGTGFKRSQNLNVACVGRQDNNPRVGEFALNAVDCLDAIQTRHLEIH
jgi:hypothetical protein